MTMQDRFKFRVPFYDWDDNFIGFDELDIEQGIEPYNYGRCYHKDAEQCTGQKDKNGNLIYENDIIYDRFDDCYKSVYWDNEDACWALQWENICGEPLKEGADFELFGNIHENADLLENKDE